LNLASQQAPISNVKKPFTLSVPPKTDIFAAPTLGYHFSAPGIYKPIRTTSFISSRATISIPFDLPNPDTPTNTLHFDQAGLLFVLPHPSLPDPSLKSPGTKSDTKMGMHPKWIKAGIEVWEGKAWGSIVVRDKWSDWSLFELPPSAYSSYSAILGGKKCATVTLEARRAGDALMIFRLEEGEEPVPVRKVPWWFMDGETEEACWVGVYGARPDPYDEATGNLEVEFAGSEVKTEEHGK